jgi:hypothetical protein
MDPGAINQEYSAKVGRIERWRFADLLLGLPDKSFEKMDWHAPSLQDRFQRHLNLENTQKQWSDNSGN